MSSMEGRLALVTGAGGGIGKAIATALAGKGATVVVLGRSAARAEDAMRDIRAKIPAAKLEPLACDLSLQSSIRSAAQNFLSSHETLNVLVNAAGVFRKERHVTPEGLELTFATNVMGYFLLSNLLLDALKRAAGQAGPGEPGTLQDSSGNARQGTVKQGAARIVNVASRYGKAKLDFDDLQTATGTYSYVRATPPTMLARVLFTQELAERLHGTGVVVNAAHPGLVKDTALLQDVGGPFRWITNTFGKPAEKGADTPVWLATSEETAAVTGKLWNKRKELPTPGMGSDPEARRRLWNECARLAQLE
jgi:NAD(P)-dependent dehydrogenase (short-subunit alcohol dehydrogenase family)